jgi:hypothetical protein
LFENLPKLIKARERYLNAFEGLQEDRIIIIDAQGLGPDTISGRIWEYLID